MTRNDNGQGPDTATSCHILDFPSESLELTVDPIGSCWTLLGPFSSKDFVTRYLGRVTVSQPSEPSNLVRLSEKVASRVKQARYFFGAAQLAPLEARGLLVYYGQMNLAKAVIALDKCGDSEPLHGFSSQDKEGSDQIKAWGASFRRKGVGPEFAAALGFETTPGTPFTLWDLVSRDPACSSLLKHAYCEMRKCFVSNLPTLLVERVDERGERFHGELTCAISSEYSQEELRHVFPHTCYLGGSSTQCYVPGDKGRQFGYERPPGLYGTISPALPGQESWLPYAVRQLATGFIISEICRYRPELIAIPRQESEIMVPVIETVLRQIERSFPNACLNKLLGIRIVFVPSDLDAGAQG